jgi:hypothetical protein
MIVGSYKRNTDDFGVQLKLANGPGFALSKSFATCGEGVRAATSVSSPGAESAADQSL